MGKSYVTTQLDFGQSVRSFEWFKASDKEVQMFLAMIKLYFTYIKDNKYQALKKDVWPKLLTVCFVNVLILELVFNVTPKKGLFDSECK